MRRAVGTARVVLWACTTLVAVLVVLTWAAPGLRDEWSFLPFQEQHAGAA